MLCDSHRHLSLIIVKHRWHVLVREHILCVNNQKTGFTCKGLSCCLFINIWIITTPNWAWKVRQLYQCTWVPTLLLVFPSSSFYLLLLLYLFLPHLGWWGSHLSIRSFPGYSLVHLVMPKMEEPISRSLLGLFIIRLLFQSRVRSQNLRLEWQCSTDHFLFKSSTPGRFPFKLQCRLKDLLVCFVLICYSSDKYLWSSRQEILQSQCQFQWKTAWCAGLKQ